MRTPHPAGERRNGHVETVAPTPNAVAVRIDEFDLSCPWLGFDRHVELDSQIVDGLDVEVGHRFEGSITGVFGQVEVDVTALQEDVEREAIVEPVPPDLLEAETSIPTERVLGVVHTEDGNEFLCHTARLSRGGLTHPPLAEKDGLFSIILSPAS